ncbi:MAG: DNA starvation/stationary phase protection protein [Verrucomicrobia bacterium]|nr:DNA starvation/stationary phase protection protein [Verrucomicrobiota bacterium]
MEEAHVKKVAATLGQLLADTYVLYVKTHNFHWNVVDSRFDMLHKMFQGQYEDLAEAADLLAEQIRIVGQIAPGSMKEFLSLTRLKEAAGAKQGGDAMIRELLHDHEVIAQGLREGTAIAQKAGDEGTADVLIERIRVHTKAIWFLKSHL